MEVAHSCCPVWRDAEGSCHPTQGGVSTAQPVGPMSPPKPGWGRVSFFGYSHSLQGLCPHQGGVSMHSHEHPLALTWYLSSHIKGDALTPGLGMQQISTLNIYLIMESRGSKKEREGMTPGIPMRVVVLPLHLSCQLALPAAEAEGTKMKCSDGAFPQWGL